MTSDLQIFRDIVNHRTPERVLYYFALTEDIKKTVTEHISWENFNEYYGLFEPAYAWPQRPEAVSPPDFSSYWKDEKLPQGTKINTIGVAEVPSNFHHFVGYISPLRNASSIKEIENYPIEDMSDWDMSLISDTVEKTHTKGKVVRGWVGHIYESAWQIRGYEEFLMDMIDRPSWAQCLLEKIANQCMIRAKAYASAGVDWIQCGDDVASQKSLMVSPNQWENILHAPWKKIWQSVKSINPDATIWYHSDGNIVDIIGKLVDAGIDVLNPLQPECLDIDAIYKSYGKHLTFDGCIGTQTTMPFGTPRNVRERVRQVIQKYGQNGGLIVSPTHILEPEVPIDNIEAFCDACRDFAKGIK